MPGYVGSRAYGKEQGMRVRAMTAFPGTMRGLHQYSRGHVTMPDRSAGLIIYRRTGYELEVLLVHPGGPFWEKKDEAAWSVPKGLVGDGEDELTAAVRETREELGIHVRGKFFSLGEFKQPSGKTIVVWAVGTDCSIDIADTKSNLFELEWPPRSGRFRKYPEVDKAAWFKIADAEIKLSKGQRPMLAALEKKLATMIK